ncbi:MAG: CopG family transcriptional regulator [Thermoanaerobaculia bacterium]
MVRTQIQLTEAQAKALKEAAARQGRSMAELVRDGVEAFLRAEAGPGREELKRRAIAALGRFRSGKSDISSEHDRYLAEAFRH